MKRLAVVGMAGVMAVVLSSCFALQGFVIADGSLAPGQKTMARFTVRPYAPGVGSNIQFFLIGRDSTDLTVGKGVWGTNGNFGGPTGLAVKGALAQALNDSGDCSGSGLNFGSIYGSFTWKGFATKTAVGGNVNKQATVDVVLKAIAAPSGSAATVVAITGAWDDTDDDGVPESTDSYACTGNATTSVYVKA